MKKIKFDSVQKYLWFFELSLGIFLFVILSALFELRYENNDDLIISGLLDGSFLGRSQWWIFNYVHVVLTYPLYLLYRFAPQISWYGAWQILTRFLTFFLPFHALTSRSRKWSVYLSVTLTWVMLFLSSLRMQIHVQYTSTAELAAFMGFVCFVFHENRKKATLSFLILEIAAYVTRPNGMKLILPLGASLFLFFSLKKEDWKDSIKKVLIGISLCLTILMAGELIAKLVVWTNKDLQASLSFNRDRTQLFDYQDFLPYEEVKDILEAHQISKAKYEALSKYVLLGWKDMEDATSELAALSTQKHNLLYIPEVIHQIGKLTLYTTSGRMSLMLLTAWLTALFSLLFSKKYCYGLVIIAYHFAKLVSWGYLCYYGRMPRWVTFPLLFIETIIAVFIFLRILFDHQEEREPWNFFQRLSCFGCISAIVLFSSIGMITQYHATSAKKESILRFESEYAQMESFCNARPENIYVASHLFYDPRQVLLLETNHQKNNNFIYSGGWFSLLPDFWRNESDYLTQGKNCYFVISSSANPDFFEKQLLCLKEYFGTAELQKESIPFSGGGTLDVYRLR